MPPEPAKPAADAPNKAPRKNARKRAARPAAADPVAQPEATELTVADRHRLPELPEGRPEWTDPGGGRIYPQP